VSPNRAAGLADILQQVVSAVQAFASGASQSDDVTVLVLRYLGPDGAGHHPNAQSPRDGDPGPS
jgi:dihydroxyacid dehydratase/phosphogluconate dehydratase